MAMSYIKVDSSKLENLDVKEYPIELKTLQKLVGGWIEVVMLHNGVMIVHEEGLLQNSPPNELACNIAKRFIVGNVVLLTGDEMKEFLSD